MTDNLKARGTKAFIWDFSGKLANNGIGFIISIVLTRLLDPSEFGLIVMVMVVIGIASVFSDSGLGLALIQRKKVLQVHYSSVFYFNVITAILLGLATFFSANLIADFYHNKNIIPLIQVMSFFYIIGALSSVHTIRLQKELNYSFMTKTALITSLVSGILGITLAFNGAGVWSLIIQSLTAGIVTNIIFWSTLQWKPSFIFSIRALKNLWSFGLHIFLVNLMNAIFTRMDVLIIGKLFNPSTLGFFSRAKSLNEMIMSYVSGSLMSVIFPVLSLIQKDLPRFQSIIINTFNIICFAIFLLIGLFYIISEELIVLLFTAKWLPSIPYFKILILTSFSIPLGTLMMSILQSRGNSKLIFKLDIYKKILLILNFYLGFIFGIEEYLYGLLLVLMITLLVNIYFGSKEINLSPYVFIKTVAIQLTITITAVSTTIFLSKEVEYGNNIIMIVFKSSLFLLFYITFSWVLKTNAYRSFYEQLKPILRNLRKKLLR